MFKSRVTTKYNVVTADFKTVGLKFEKQGIEPSLVEDYIAKFKSLRAKNKIKEASEKNIDSWGSKDFKTFKKFVDNLSETRTKTEEKKITRAEGAKLITENEEWVVYKILSKDACLLYGANTKWCITEKETNHWETYEVKGDFYFIIAKNKDKDDPLAKIAIFVLGNKEQYFDAKDNELTYLPRGIPAFKRDPFNIWDKVKDLTDINVSSIGLTSLEGAPKAVGGDFDCSENYLTSLKGAPKTVRGGFYCTSNKLTSLKGAPKTVGVDFDCSRNKLTSLEGAPEKVGGDFYCYGNKRKFTEAEVRAVCNVQGKVTT